MDFFVWVYLIDAVAIVTIAALVLKLCISRPGDDRPESVETVRALARRTHLSRIWFRRTKTQVGPAPSGEPQVFLNPGPVSDLW
jgi:hypothetical protein